MSQEQVDAPLALRANMVLLQQAMVTRALRAKSDTALQQGAEPSVMYAPLATKEQA